MKFSHTFSAKDAKRATGFYGVEAWAELYKVKEVQFKFN